MDRLVDVRDLGLIARGRRRVAHIDLAVEPGQIVGLVGPNGAGKTSLLRLLAGLLRPSEGTGRVLGEDIGRPRTARPGYMPQSAAVQPDLTVAELIHYRAALHGIASAEVPRVIAEAGLSAFADRRLATLSGGWQRRAELAATLVTRPPLLLLDEPTTGLDQDARAAIWALIAAVAADGAGLIVNTHDLAEAERCDTLLLLVDGTTVARGTPGALMASTGQTRLDAAWPILVAR